MKYASVLLLAVLGQAGIAQVSNTSRVQGRVLERGTEVPLSNATIELRRAGGAGGALQVATSGKGGEFVFRNVAPGEYRIAAARDGYVRSEYGQRSPAGTGTRFTIAPSQQLENFRVLLTPTGAISGRITGPLGEPVANADVVAFTVSYSSGQRSFSVVRSVRTNDLGEYRLFWLAPGKYYVGVQAPDGLVTTTIVNNGTGTDTNSLFLVRRTFRSVTALPAGSSTSPKGLYLLTYFPGTTEGQSALPVDVAAGAQISNINLPVRPVETYRVRGLVLSGRENGPVQIRLLRSVQPPFQQYTATTNSPSGSFEIAGVIPGPYLLFASGPGGLSGRLAFDVINSDAVLSVPLQSDVTFPVRIRIEGQKEGQNDERLAGLRMDVVGDPWVNGSFSNRRAVPAGGSSSASLPLGTYRIYLSPILSQQRTESIPRNLQNVFVKTMRLDGRDVLKSGLNIEGQPAGTLEIILGTRPGSIHGRVTDDAKQPVPGATVLVIPAENERFRTDMYRTAATDSSGRFQLTNLVPGDYKIFAWDEVEKDSWLDPDFLKVHESRATALRVAEDGDIERDLTAIQQTR